RILVEPEANLVDQQKQLLATEGIEVEVTDDAIEAMADLAAEANDRLENIGARRLMTIIEKVFEEVSFDADIRATRGDRGLLVDGEFVRQRIEHLVSEEDLGRFVL
ncbi:MAG: HslU--HslV peptidase ATPase subunit, partial [Planctomycetota bacterium]|nr:HslU--HslV peptidase ATPase subunit [Planctomycetota bacterium]